MCCLFHERIFYLQYVRSIYPFMMNVNSELQKLQRSSSSSRELWVRGWADTDNDRNVINNSMALRSVITDNRTRSFWNTARTHFTVPLLDTDICRDIKCFICPSFFFVLLAGNCSDRFFLYQQAGSVCWRRPRPWQQTATYLIWLVFIFLQVVI